MSKSYLGAFRIGEVIYQHEIDTENDATYLIGRYRKAIFKVTSDANLYDPINRIGSFRMGDGFMWYYEPISGDRIDTFTHNLIQAELIIFKQLLGEEVN